MRRTPNSPFVLLAVLALMPILGGARGCEGDVNVGGDRDAGPVTDAGSVYEPCGALSCGESCTLCDPADAECIETAVEKMCQADGVCSATVAECSAPYDPCGGLSCGASCTICDPADTECFETAADKSCQPDGTCSAIVPECSAPYDPCGGLSCGESCTVCDPADPDCAETDVVKMCQPDGTCSASVAECSTPYDPCGGLTCGESCTLCDPADTECVETAVTKMCQADGVCSASVAECSGTCSVTARGFAAGSTVRLELGTLCDDLYLCLDSRDDGGGIQDATSAFDCQHASLDPSSPCTGTSCRFTVRPSLLDAAELAEVCAADDAARATDEFVCAVYL